MPKKKHVTQAALAEQGRQRDRAVQEAFRYNDRDFRVRMYRCFLSGLREQGRWWHQRTKGRIKVRPLTRWLIAEFKAQRERWNLAKS